MRSREKMDALSFNTSFSKLDTQDRRMDKSIDQCVGWGHEVEGTVRLCHVLRWRKEQGQGTDGL